MNAHLALERILQEKEQPTGRLDLSALGLTRYTIPPELWELTHLEELNLGNCYHYDEKKKQWVRKEHNELYRFDSGIGKRITIPYFNRIASIPFALSKLPQLKVLLLDSNQIPKIENLEQLPLLQRLDLQSNQIPKIENLGQLPLLQSLYLGGNQIPKIENLGQLPLLQSLSLGSNQIPKIENIEQLPLLQSLDLGSNQIPKIENLGQLPLLQSLDLGSNQIRKIENLEQLPLLQSLDLRSNQIPKIENLGQLPLLQSLDLGSNQIRKIENLEQLPLLQSLDLRSNQIPKIENLGQLPLLQSLNLGSNQIPKIENLGQLPLLQRLYLWDNQIPKIENLGQLPLLQRLDLWDNQIPKIENLGQLPLLQSLDLQSNQIPKIENLGQLPLLQSLDLQSNQIPKIENLGQLPLLQSLDLQSNQIPKIENLGQLPLLQSLDLQRNQIPKIENLEQLPLLQSLHLGSNQIPKIENLEQLPLLQRLDLQSNQIPKIENLGQLPLLQSLYLGGNQIPKIENLGQLPLLQSLYLQVNQIPKIENLGQLPLLQRLDLRSNQIPKIENLGQLPLLQSLNLGDNQIPKIENLEQLPQLQSLSLGGNQIPKIENLGHLKGLKSLGIGGNQTKEFPEEILDLPWLEDINLKGNLWSNIPQEITAKRDCLSDARLWFADLSEERQPNYELKLIVCGNGSVGKSTLIDYLRLGHFNGALKSTHAIQLIHWQPPEAADPVSIHIWDFGGQEIYHATHRLFMRSRALYLVLWDKETHVKEFYEEEGVKYKNYGVGYWLDQVRSGAADCPLILVENKIDDRRFKPVALPKDDMERRFGKMQYEEVSARSGEGVATLKSKILEAFHNMPEYGMPMPASWCRCREAIVQLAAEKDDIDLETFYNVCEEAKVRQASKPAVLRYLHDSGALFHQKGLFKDRIILNQKKAIEGIYTLFNRNGIFWKLLAGKGPFRFSDLKSIWDDKGFPEEQHRLLLTFMETCKICFPRKEQDYADDAMFIAPMFLPETKPKEVEALWGRLKREAWHFQFEYEFLHRTFIHRFIVAAGKLAETDRMWFTGIEFTHSFTNVLVESWQTEREKGLIQISVAGQNRAKLLALVRREFQNIHPRKEEEIERFVSVNGADFVSYKTVREHLEDKNPVIRSKGGEKLNTEDFRELMTEHKEQASTHEEHRQGKKEETIADLQPDLRKATVIKEEVPGEGKKIILFLSANPTKTAKLQLKEEYGQIQKKLEDQEIYKVLSYYQVNVDELIDAVVDHEPHILHFAGHGSSDEEDLASFYRTLNVKDVSEGGGLILNDADKRSYRLLKTEEIRDIFKHLKDIVPKLEMMVFNACFSEAQARAVSELDITVVGIRTKIPDEAAIGFANGFYRQLGKNFTPEKALQVGRAKARAGNMSYPESIVMYKNGEQIL